MSLAFHPNGMRLAVADFGEMKIHLRDLSTGALITNPGPQAVSCVEFTPDGKRLAALGYDGNVHLADARTGEDILVLRGFGPPIGAQGYTPRIAFSPDGSRIASHFPNILNLWDLGPRSGLAIEPETAGFADSLRRSRALAEAGDAAGALAAAARAGASPARRRVWLDRARRLAVSPRRSSPRPRRPGAGPGGPVRRTLALHRALPDARHHRLDGGLADARGKDPVPR
jgi:hypothetical protein